MADVRTCKKCERKFGIIEMERRFLDKYGYSDPERCPKCRHQERQELRGWRDFYKRPCDKCGREIVTIYPPESGLIVYCEPCFNDFYNRFDPLAQDENYRAPTIDERPSEERK